MDLRNNDTLFALMDDMYKWRVRSVERINYASTLWIERTRILHANPLTNNFDPADDVLNIHPAYLSGPGGGDAWVRLPLAAFPKKPLLDLHIEVAEKPVFRIPRRISDDASARYLARRVKKLIEELKSAGLGDIGSYERLQEVIQNEKLLAFLAGMCKFQTGVPYQVQDGDLRDYVEEKSVQEHWTGKLNEEWGEQFFDCSVVDNAALNPLLTLQWINKISWDGEAEPFRINSPDADVPAMLNAVMTLLKELRHCQSVENEKVRAAARKTMGLYKFLGRFWVALADCKLDLREPFIATISEMRTTDDIKLSQDTNAAGLWRQAKSALLMRDENLGPVVTFKDAKANEVSIRIADPNVEMSRNGGHFVTVLNDHGNDVTVHLEEIDQKELIFIYSAEQQRDRVVNVGFILHPTASIRVINWVVLGIVLFTTFAIVAGWRIFVRKLNAPHVALLLTPSTFATSLLLVRDASALSRELTKRIRFLTAGILSFLWFLAIAYYVFNQISLGIE